MRPCSAAGGRFRQRRRFAVLAAERHVDVHTGTRTAEKGLWHKGGVKVVGGGGGLYRKLEGGDVVGGTQRLVIFKVDFMLPSRNLMVGGFDFESHFLKGQANVSAALFTEVDGALVEISAGVVGFCGGAALLVKFEKEEFALGSHVEFIPHVVGLFDDLFEYVAGLPAKGFMSAP